MADCRKGEGEKKVRNSERKAPVTKPEENTQNPPISITERKAPISIPVTTELKPSGSGKKVDYSLSDNDWKTPRRTAGLKMKENVPGSTTNHEQDVGHSSVNAFSILQEKEGNVEEVVESRETKGSWNVRGLNHKGKQESMLEFCNVNKIGVGGLLETKLKGNKVQELMDKKFASWEFYNSPTVEGRLLIIWRKRFVRVKVIAESSQHVHCVVKMAGQAYAFCLTLVYGFNTIEEQKTLWQNLVQLTFLVSPWLILGDFNSVFYVDDRNGGNPITHNEMVDSNLWLAQSNVEVLKSFVFSLATEAIGIKPFRFYNFWADHHDFQNLVEQSWQRPMTTRAKSCYSEAKLLAQSHPRDKTYQDQEATAAAKFDTQEKMYHKFLSLKSKITWLQKGDSNTSYFHACLKKRKMENRITSFITDQGLINNNFSEVVAHFLNHFRGFMGSNSTVKTSIPDTKSPGPDGFGSGFFKSMWSVIGGEICAAITNFFETGFMPPEFHNTMISLIPKTENPATTIDFRPIACCTTIYKCISKLLCSRLATVLPFLVHQNQGAFVQGRSIAHNVMILQDILKNYRQKNTSPRCAIKIDISKAYDTVDWNFVEDLLNALNFPGKFIQLVMICIKSTTYSLLMNGRIQGGFQGAKGLRQDDLILLSKGSKQSIIVLKEVLDGFSNTTGLHINVSKSQIFFGGVDPREKRVISRDIGLAKGSFPLKYLGVPLRPTKWKAEDCGIIIKKNQIETSYLGK
ncbi:uncharacterized protein LOC133800246 [Humulus lupulus]|uniref:uncharacterized protein LOC133800246 n=1 Tax=Humulus lupulus TaxID=3486 RepID=UPI002B401DBF|nr:uncharacterized protein LOC133800246 [Humulus lupulus]